MQRFLRDLIGYYVIMEGIFFYAGFAMMLALKRQGKMIGIGEQFRVHHARRERPPGVRLRTDQHHQAGIPRPPGRRSWQAETVDLVRRGVEFEQAYAHDACPGRAARHQRRCSSPSYVEYIADRRLERIGLPRQYETENPFPWMGHTMDLNKEKNFFETRVTEYQPAGALDWD